MEVLEKARVGGKSPGAGVKGGWWLVTIGAGSQIRGFLKKQYMSCSATAPPRPSKMFLILLPPPLKLVVYLRHQGGGGGGFGWGVALIGPLWKAVFQITAEQTVLVGAWVFTPNSSSF